MASNNSTLNFKQKLMILIKKLDYIMSKNEYFPIN